MDKIAEIAKVALRFINPAQNDKLNEILGTIITIATTVVVIVNQLLPLLRQLQDATAAGQ